MHVNTYNPKHLEIWENWTEGYAKIQKNPSVFGFTLLNLLRINEQKNILDAGCGGGYLHTYMKYKMQKDAHLTAFDFSTHMVERSAARLKKSFTSNQPGDLDFLSKEEIDSVNFDDPLFQQLNYHPVVGSVEDLYQFKDNTFDTYFSNLCIQLVTNEQLALNEAFRVLQPGGKLGISVWGNRKNCQASTIIVDSLVEAGLFPPFFMENPRFREDKDVVIKMVKQAGFTNILCWFQQSAFDVFNLGDTQTFLTPDACQVLSTADDNKKEQFYKAFQQKLNNNLQQNEPLKFECIMVIAQKPNKE